MPSARTLARGYARRRFTVLFAVLLVTLAGQAFASKLFPVANPLAWLLGLSLVAAVLSVGQGALRWALWGLAVVFVLARLVEPWSEHAAPHHAAQLALALACLLAAGAAAGRALAAGPVDGEHIFAALSAYMLVGIAFGAGYFLIEAALPGSFTPAPSGAFTPQRAIYFSFVTQATVGYGDVVPLREEAQGLVIVQAVGGQMYLAVLVARLVSLYSAQKR
jgi:hypothetical protein